LNYLPGFLHPTRLAHQSNKDVQGATVAVFGAVTQRSLPTPLSKRSVKSSTCVVIRESALRKFWNPFRSGQQVHVPQMVVVHVWIVGEAFGVGAYQRDRHVPILKLFRRPSSLQPVHKTSITRGLTGQHLSK
jgi:hypothetical protein